jgi:hypothetical protein
VEFDARSIYPIGYTALADRIAAGAQRPEPSNSQHSQLCARAEASRNAPASAVV